MKFKEFIKITEEQSGTDKGLMGFGKPCPNRKPSDGQPFSKYLGPTSGSGNEASGNKPMFMKKKMQKL